ncbi:hypothetical protein ACFTAO_51400 [Paenibacillus rhizoplanae]
MNWPMILLKQCESIFAAEKRDPEYSDIRESNLLDGLEEIIHDLDYRGGIYTEYELNLNAVNYWADIIKAKISVIGAVGGVDLMREIQSALGKYDDENNRFPGLFDSLADGVSGWMV